MSYADLELKVVRWAEARSIVRNSDPAAQARKTLEEAGELVEAASALRFCGEQLKGCWKAAYKDALGDVLVTLIVGAATADVDLMECLAQAYDEIKDRKGTLRADGVFVKQ
jgi:NTP pyrophosphatase (non-canonical NTP hydrolase)